ncbi:Sec-independent protein translocase TatB [Streptomyces sp. NPDC046900]|uniref:Sec-independent protein translocase TatB n=1 Tax=Streptomyces sp. NPDC046900 TaxID=3155473 RepID=UPI0033DDE2D0
MIFDVGPLEVVALAAVAVFVFGPDKLPRMITETMGFVRRVREFSDSTKQEIRKELGPEFEEFDFQDLNPKTFVRKQLNLHGDDIGLKEIQDLRSGIANDTHETAAPVRAMHTQAQDKPDAPHAGRQAQARSL